MRNGKSTQHKKGIRSMKVMVEDFEVLPEDTYDAVFVNVEAAESQLGEFWKWEFGVDHDGKPRRVTAASSPKLTRGTKAGQWVAAIQGRPVDSGDEFDFGAIQGKPCRLLLIIDDTDRGQFNKVDRVMPPRPEQKQQPVAVSQAPDEAPF
jgi:hypothetical protein